MYFCQVRKKERLMQEERNWSYRNFQIREGLKPGSKHFQYFFVVFEGGEKNCNYCVWVDDDTLSGFAASGDFHEVSSSGRGNWSKWVREKIDQGDFRNRVLKFEKTGQKEIDLTELKEKLEFE
jgi:hypothetical protein